MKTLLVMLLSVGLLSAQIVTINAGDAIRDSRAVINSNFAYLDANKQALDADLTALSNLAATAGLLKRTGAGAFALAVAGTDYVVPGGNVATANALAANPGPCDSGDFVTDIAADGTLTCSTPGGDIQVTSGSGAPSASCTAGHAVYHDTSNNVLYDCTATDTWKLRLNSTGTGPIRITGETGSAPSTPSTGQSTFYFLSTDKAAKVKDDAGNVSTTVREEACPGGQFVDGISASQITCSEPAGGSSVNFAAMFPGGSFQSSTTIGVSVANQVEVVRVTFPLPFDLTDFGFSVSGTHPTEVCSFGLYSLDGNTKHADTGTFAVASGGGATDPITPVAMSAGQYFLAFTCSGTNATLSAFGTSHTAAINQGSTIRGSAANAATTGALPATLGSITPSTTAFPAVNLSN